MISAYRGNQEQCIEGPTKLKQLKFDELMEIEEHVLQKGFKFLNEKYKSYEKCVLLMHFCSCDIFGLHACNRLVQGQFNF